MGTPDPQDPGTQDEPQAQPQPQAVPDTQAPQEQAQAPSSSPLTPFQQHFADFWHGKGMSDAGIAGMLGTAHYEAPQGYTSYNQESGASGAYQYLASRATQEQQYAQQHGLDPWHPDAQNGFAYSEIQPNGSEYDSTGKYLWHAADPRMAADVMVRGFERPGAVAGQESAGAQHVAAGLYPAIQARYAQQADSGQPPADPAGVNVAIDRLLKSEGPAAGGKFDHQILPPTVTAPQPSGVDDSVNRLLEQEKAAQTQEGQQGQQQPMPPGYDWGSLGSALRELPRGIPMGFLSKLGLPADVFNFMQHYYGEHPADPSQVGIYGVPLPPEAQTQLDKEAAAGVKPPTGLQMLEQAVAHPSSLFNTDNKQTLEAAKGMPSRVPLGTEDLASAFKYATGIDLHQQDQTTGGTIASDIGQFIGAGMAPTKDIPEAASFLASPNTKSLLGGIVHHILMPAGASGGLDLGKEVVDKYSPDQGTANAIGIGSRIALGVAGTALAHRSLEIANEAKEGAATGMSAPGQVNTAFKSIYKGDEAAADAAKAQASQEIADHNPETLLPGYEAPAALRTASLPIQQMYHDMVQKDMILRGRADRNAIVLQEGMRPEGDAQDAVTAVQNMQNTRQQTIDHSIDLLKEESEQKMLAAQQSSTGRTLQPGDTKSQFDLGQSMVDGLNATRDDWFAHADNQWDIAREHGYLDAQAPVNAMYGKLGELMSDNIKYRQGEDFPWQHVAPLYSTVDKNTGALVKGGGANPQTGLFDAYGNRRTDPTVFPILKQGQTSIDDLKAVDSRLGNAIRIEQGRISAPGQGGNPALLKNMVQVRNHVWDAIQDGAAQAGQNHTVALQTAMDATAQAYNTFVHGGLSKLLNEQGGAAIAPAELDRYLGTSLKAVNSADAFSKAIAGRTGAADTRAGNPHAPPAQLQDQTWNTMSDWLRQTYLNAYHNGSPGTGQKWLNNHSGFFDALKGNPIIDNLRTELQEHANASSPARTGAINEAQKQLQGDLDKSAAGIFLGKPQARLNAVFGARDPGMAMTQLMRDTVQADPTLNAFHGLQRMLWDRLSMEAERGGDPLRPGENYYSGKQAKAFLDANAPAFDAMRKADPAFGQRLDRLVNTLAIEDRSRTAPGLELPQSVAKAKPWSPLSSGSVRVLQLAAGSLGRHILPKIFGGGMVSSMQASGQASAFAREFAQHLPESGLLNKIPDPVGDARRAIEDALFDPEKMRGLLAPVAGKSGQKWAAGLEPWLRASGVMLPQGFLNPEEPPGAPPAE